MNDFLPIMEEFYSIQGEGFFSGHPSYFIRLGGCNVQCHWCDVKDSWNAENYPGKNIEEIIAKIPKNVKRVIITGGEPSMWNLNNLTSSIKEKNIKIHLETSGTNTLRGYFDWICLSPKKNKLPLNENYKLANELKIIIYNNDDFRFAQTQSSIVTKECKLYLQPEWSKKEELFPKIFQFALDNPKWNISTQVHKFLNVE